MKQLAWQGQNTSGLISDWRLGISGFSNLPCITYIEFHSLCYLQRWALLNQD
jgi:hypothetical protein